MIWLILLAALQGYLLGSICFGVLISRYFSGQDIRQQGSGNAGATNMLRTLGWKAALPTLVADVLKAVLASFIGLWLFGFTGGLIAGVAAICGHNWPVFFKFKGGRGIATSFGSLLVLMPYVGLLALAVFIIAVALSRYVSLGSVLAGLSVPLFALIFFPFDQPLVFIYALVLMLFAIWQHRGNIKRLATGTERRLQLKKKA